MTLVVRAGHRQKVRRQGLNYSGKREIHGAEAQRRVEPLHQGMQRTIEPRVYHIDMAQDHYTTMTLDFRRFTPPVQTLHNMLISIPFKWRHFQAVGYSLGSALFPMG